MFSKCQPERIITVVTALNLTTSKRRTKRKPTCMMGGAVQLDWNFEVPSGRASCHPPHLRLTPRCACRQPAMASGAPKLGVHQDRALTPERKKSSPVVDSPCLSGHQASSNHPTHLLLCCVIGDFLSAQCNDAHQNIFSGLNF